MTKSVKTSAMVSAMAIGAATASAPAVAQIDQIIVSAERREAGIQDVAVAISAFDEVAFARLQAVNLEDLHLKAPNITIVKNTTTSNSAQIYIRGIGRDDSTWNVESGVAVYVDGVYLPQQSGALMDLIEFERVEVLRGPQGTLYGRSATGGTVKFVTKRPNLEELAFVGDATIGSFSRLDLRGSVSAPLIEGALAVKFDAISRSDEGFLDDIDSAEKYNGTDRQTARLSLFWVPNEKVDVYLAGDIQHDRSPINTLTPTRLDTGGFGTFNDPDGDGIGAPAFGSNFITNPGIDDVNRYDGYGLMGQVNWNVGIGTVTSLTSYRSFDYTLEGDLDGQTLILLDFFQDIDDSTFQQEIQFVSEIDGPFEFVVGGFYINDDITVGADNTFNGFHSESTQETNSLAIFGEGTVTIGDWLSVTGGVRYSRDKKDITQSGFSLAQGPGGAAAFDIAISDTFTAVTPKAVIELRPFEASGNSGFFNDLLIYAQYQEGYKTGGVANGRPTNATNASTIFGEETSDNIEFGFKLDALDNRLRINLAYFWMDQSNLAATVLDPATNEISVVTADAEMNGLELEIFTTPVEGLTLFATVATLDDAITRAEPGSPFVPGVSELKNKPDWHYVFGGEYQFAFGNLGTVGAGVTYTASDEIFRNVANTPNIQTPQTGIMDARLFFESADGHWGLELAGKNLNSEEYWYTGISVFGRFYAPEATWSLTFKARL